jgi:hypothetical protein
MTRRQLDRAILKLFNEEREHIPRVLFPMNLYNYAHDLYKRSSTGRRELKRRKRASRK